MKKRKNMRQFLYIMLCSIAILLIAAGCVPQNEPEAEQSVQISSAGNIFGYEQGGAPQDVSDVEGDNQNVQQNDEQNKEELEETEKIEETGEHKENSEPQNDNPYGIDPVKPMVALTFDDGPSRYTWDIVSTLQSHGARATFFIVGNQVATHQAAIDYTLANHNEIASHSFSHANLTQLSDTEILNQIRPVDTALLKQHQYAPSLYRVPYGSRDERVLGILEAEGKPVIGWSIDPYDWKVKDKTTIVNHVLTRVQDGDIILMHDIYESTAQATAELVPALQERGYQIVTVSEMFRFRGVELQPGEYYHSLPQAEEANM